MRKGYVLVLVLAIVIVLSLGILAVIKSTGSLTTVKIKNLEELRAQYLAEAGMTYANWKCEKDGCHTLPSVLTMAATGFDRDIKITVTPTTPNTPPYKIVVTADYPDI